MLCTFIPSQIRPSVCFKDVGLLVRHHIICKLTIYGRAKSQDVECAAPKTVLLEVVRKGQAD